jgi:hypothetical protein
MTPFSTILTHPGSAHKDEFLACCVLLATAPCPILRREPTEADLADPAMAVVDVGHRHEPALNNFDHHQLPADAAPTCALSLVLQHLGLYTDARAFCDWLEPAEWFDCRGPNVTAQWLGVERDIVGKMQSPIDGTLLRRFAAAQQLSPGDPLWQIMHFVGTDLLDYVRNLRARLTFIGQHAQVWTLDGLTLSAENSQTPAVVFLPRTEPLPEDPSAGLDRYVQEQGWTTASSPSSPPTAAAAATVCRGIAIIRASTSPASRPSPTSISPTSAASSPKPPPPIRSACANC